MHQHTTSLALSTPSEALKTSRISRTDGQRKRWLCALVFFLSGVTIISRKFSSVCFPSTENLFVSNIYFIFEHQYAICKHVLCMYIGNMDRAVLCLLASSLFRLLFPKFHNILYIIPLLPIRFFNCDFILGVISIYSHQQHFGKNSATFSGIQAWNIFIWVWWWWWWSMSLLHIYTHSSHY